MKRGLALLLTVAFILIPLSGFAQIYPPKPGVEMPRAYFDRIATDRTAFQFERAWIQKVERIKKNREAYIEDHGFYNRQLISSELKKSTAVTGTVQVPVFMSKYSNTGADPYATSVMDTKLFTGPFSPQTLTQYYSEISYGDINVTGSVYGWFQLPNTDTYYEGGAGCQGLCGSAQVGQFLTQTLANWDASVNFGAYDNDGPDGLPNSGDDDGYVDFAAFVHPEAGAECGGAATNNIWSHRWVIAGWTGSPWTSADPAAGGGFIRVNDYVIQPAFNCGGTTVIDIGVFCHEFGHAFGLPDLYDTNGGSAGIGHWGLMGSGSWNTVTRPAHMSAWAKNELGWVNLVEVTTPLLPYAVDNVEFNRPVYRANVAEERWRLEGGCAIGGARSMRLGLRPGEAGSRNWIGGGGYGNAWDEIVSHDFSYDGTPGPVMFTYDYTFDSETNYDYTYAQIDVGGTVTTLATYHGTGTGTASFDISSYLTGPTDYKLRFRFTSDVAYSDEDGNWVSSCGAFVFDNVGLNGGGETYSGDFETREDGWWVDMTDPSEYYLLENRQALGSDAAVHGGGGLAIWHIDQNVAHSQNGNTGGAANNMPRGVALEQADGLYHLDSNTNRGDAGDAYPGSSGNVLFDSPTTPSSDSYNSRLTRVKVQMGGPNGDPINITASGGWRFPIYSTHAPLNETTGNTAFIDIFGIRLVYGCSVELRDGANVITASNVEWIGHDYVIAEVDLTGASEGKYDIVLTNPGDGAFSIPDTFEVIGPSVPVFINAFTAEPANAGVQLAWVIDSDEEMLGFQVYRRNDAGGPETAINASGLIPADRRSTTDRTALAGISYEYTLAVVLADGSEKRSRSARVQTRARQLTLERNHPNPFNPSTTISYVLPEKSMVDLSIYDVRGVLVKTLVRDFRAAGHNEVAWDGRDNQGQPSGSGIYFYKLSVGKQTLTRKMVLLK